MSRPNVALHLGDCLEVLKTLEDGSVDAVVTDPPYGVAYRSGMTGHDGGVALPGIVGDEDTSFRDAVLEMLQGIPALVFGSWKRPKAKGTRAVLIWDKGDHVGMGDLKLPWKPNTEEVHVIGRGFAGHRGSSVLRHNAPVTWNSTTFGRKHPHEKPVSLMVDLIEKCPPGCTVLDPFMGSGATGVACVRTGRDFIGVEIDPTYHAIARRRIDAELDKLALLEPAS